MNVGQLIRQRKKAIDHFQFEDAERLDIEIGRYMVDDKKKTDIRKCNSQKIEMTKKRIESKIKKVGQKKEILNNFYEEQFQNLEDEKKRLFRKLSKQYKNAMKREENRPIPEVRMILERSKYFAEIKDYFQASQLYNYASQTKEEILMHRKKQCYHVFKHLSIKMKNEFAQRKHNINRDYMDQMSTLDKEEDKLQARLVSINAYIFAKYST